MADASTSVLSELWQGSAMCWTGTEDGGDPANVDLVCSSSSGYTRVAERVGLGGLSRFASELGLRLPAALRWKKLI